MKQLLGPSLDDLRLECVLMQAWKKTSAYLRSHSWYADTLGIDYESLRVPAFIRELQQRLHDPFDWQSRPLEFVPAPKNQRWTYQNEKWEPSKGENIDLKLRPLAHLDLQDQVVATAVMLCFADRVETAMGDPRLPITTAENRRRVLAYGNRLFCDTNKNELRHRWGSSKLYRQYFKDYQTFLERPKIVAESIKETLAALQPETKCEVAIIQSDLSKFYDRVRPALLQESLRRFQRSSKEDDFFSFAARVFNWNWSNQQRANRYAKDHDISNFNSVALPQGLVAAGFFANVVLNDLNTALREGMGQKLPGSDVILEDACFYVDDLRVVLRIPQGTSEGDVRVAFVEWLQNLLDCHAQGLKISSEKTEVTIEGREKRFLVLQSKEATRIQSQVSDTFDMLHGTELITAIEGFFHTQQRFSTDLTPDKKAESGLLVGVPDMRDDTAARFAAGKFRKTFRSLRPLLADEAEPGEPVSEEDESTLPHHLVFTKTQLDDRAKFFAALLIEEWTKNPGHVRLLRIGLDLYPDLFFLNQVLTILQPGWKSTAFRKAKREVRLYCLAELFRAGATETGFVQDDECLPSAIKIETYHGRLVEEARSIVEAYLAANAPGSRFPWYLLQQVFLYLAARNAFPEIIVKSKTRGGKLLIQYWKFAKFMFGEMPPELEQRSIFLVMAKTAYGIPGFDFLSSKARVSDQFLIELNRISPFVAHELWLHLKNSASQQLRHTAEKLGLENHRELEATIADLCEQKPNPFYEEENLLEFAQWLLSRPDLFRGTITPWNIGCSVSDKSGYEFGKLEQKDFDVLKRGGKAVHLFEPTEWCETEEEGQKLKIGLLLRYALRGATDFYSNFSKRETFRELRYKKPISHWEQQRYSGFHGRDAFGPPWLPISSFTEDLLFQLLRWPGSGLAKPNVSLAHLLDKVTVRLNYLRKQRGRVTSVTFLEQKASYPTKEPTQPWQRFLRIGIVQSIVPNHADYMNHINDPTLLDDRNLRRQQRAHLASIMEGVAQMLRIRETHRPQGSIDLLIFPELAIHPNDINPLLLPFIRKHKCIMLFGQVYHPMDLPGSRLINSCLWVLPGWNTAQGFHIRRIEQGKRHLIQEEYNFRPQPEGFRPAQWLIEYQWHSDETNHRPLILSASVCYDATDLKLAADLREKSDLYIICALNQDVGTFDRMSEGLHYHMFQGVIVVNNGEYGGSSFYLPFAEQYRRQVFHLHGQPQVSIAFAEISPQKMIERPLQSASLPEGNWKTCPAGWVNHD